MIGVYFLVLLLLLLLLLLFFGFKVSRQASFTQCFDTVGCATGRLSMANLSPMQIPLCREPADPGVQTGHDKMRSGTINLVWRGTDLRADRHWSVLIT